MAVPDGRDIVLSDGHVDDELTVLIGHHRLVVARHSTTVHIDLHAVNRDIGAGVDDGATHLEGTDIGEIDAVVYHRRTADETALLLGRELMAVERRNDIEVRTLAAERHSLDDIVAIDVGLGL